MSPRDRRHVVDADRGELAIAADAPVQVFLQLHDGDEAGFVDRRQRHHGAGDERAVARFVGRPICRPSPSRPDGFVVVLRQAAFDAERAAEGAGEAADVEQVGAIGEQVEPHDLLAAGSLERRFRFEAADGAGFHFVLAERVLDERTALRAAAAFDIDDVFHVAADLLERFLQHFRFVRLAEQAVEPREVDVDYRHSDLLRQRRDSLRLLPGMQGSRYESGVRQRVERLRPSRGLSA